MDEMKNLAGMFSSMAQMLQDREDALVKRIGLLEARVAGLEEKIREAEMRGMMQEEMAAECRGICSGGRGVCRRDDGGGC